MNEHVTSKRSFPYFSSGIIWEGHCSCGNYYTGKCISEAEVDYRLRTHVEAKKVK